MRFSRLWIFILTMPLVINAASVQQKSQRFDADSRLKVLTARLNLTESQRKKVSAILNDELVSVSIIDSDNSLSAQEKTSRIGSVHNESASRIRVLLNDDQKREFDEIQQELEVHAGYGIGYGMGSGQGSWQSSRQGYGFGQGYGQGHGCQMPDADDHVNYLAERLSLNPSQQARIKTIIEGQLVRLQNISADKSISENDKSEKIHDVRESTAEKVRDQLSESQKRKFDELRRDPEERLRERRERGEDCSLIWMFIEQG